MITRKDTCLPFAAETLFGIAADIERYPDFVTGWISAQILRHDDHSCRVDQVLGFGPVRIRFWSDAVFQRPSRIEVTSRQAPFRFFSLTWQFDPAADGGCLVSVAADLQLQSRTLQHVVDHLLPQSVEDIMAAFAARARELQTAAAASIANLHAG